MTPPLCIHPALLRHAKAEAALESAWREVYTCKQVNEAVVAKALRAAQQEEREARAELDEHNNVHAQ